jgi:stearoyl-CoA desaturase (Delta-9 desaturase)
VAAIVSSEVDPRISPPAADDRDEIDAGRLDVGSVRKHTSPISQFVTLLAVIVPPLGLLSAMGVLWGVAFRPLDLVLFLVFYVLCGFGTTIGYHRYFTHRAFETGPVIKATLGILGSMTIQGPITQWVTDHRKHHARSDQEGDPHTPHLQADTLIGTVKGLWHAHLGWLFTTKGMERGHLYGQDLYNDRIVRTIDRLYLLWVLASLGLPFLLGAAIGGSWHAGFEAMIWAGLIRILCYEHATFAVNSICHSFGRRDYQVRDESRNNWVVAVLTFGEGWHNNHHAFPRSARQGLRRAQVDVSWMVIRTLERCKLVRAVRLPTPAQVARVSLPA